jgi:hypothetical protein
MSEDTDMMQRWEALSRKANEAFVGHPTDDVAGALALLTAMMIAGSIDETDRERRLAQVLLHAGAHFKLTVELVPAFMDAAEARNDNTKGRH